MRDTKESRLLLVLLVVMAFALITVDIRGGENSPLDGPRQAAQSAFGPVEDSVAGAVDPVGNAIDAVRDSGDRSGTIHRLERENAALKQQLGSSDLTRHRAQELDKLLKTAGAGQYTVKGAQVIAIGAAQGFSWTVTIDAGSRDGIARDMTVIDGDGLVGRVTTVGPSTSTVLLANDPDFTVGTRLEGSMELGFATGEGNRPMQVQLLNGKADVHKGDRLVTFGSQAGKPFVPGVPVGRVTGLQPSDGNLTKTVQVQPYVGFTRLDVVGVVVVGPRTDPRDSVLPARPTTPPPPKASPKNSPTVQGTDGPLLPGTGEDGQSPTTGPGEDTGQTGGTGQNQDEGTGQDQGTGQDEGRTVAPTGGTVLPGGAPSGGATPGGTSGNSTGTSTPGLEPTPTDTSGG